MMICKFNHDGNCYNCSATQHMRECKLPCDTIFPISNADHIRSMSDEELAYYLASLMTATRRGVAYSVDGDRWLSWLQQLAEGWE